jgi:hypothetical protein
MRFLSNSGFPLVGFLHVVDLVAGAGHDINVMKEPYQWKTTIG